MPLVNSSVQTEEFENLLGNSDEFEISSRSGTKKYERKLGTSFSSLKLLRAHQDSWMSRRLKKCLIMMICLVLFTCFGILYFGYYCSEASLFCALRSSKEGNPLTAMLKKDYIGKPLNFYSKIKRTPMFEEVVSKDFQFDISDHDVIVFLHMQKTGGTTFGKHLVNDLELDRECICHRRVKKRCSCLRPGPNKRETWLFSRYSTGWKCGLHADWTELTSCVDAVMNVLERDVISRRYFYITYLRDPVQRYLSEFYHVGRGATWRRQRLFCNGRSATKKEVPKCYAGHYWENLTLDNFLSCKSNLANNRQTRMLADLTLVNCYNTSTMSSKERGDRILASAKENLKKMAFFGIVEKQEQSQYTFEETFNLKFNVKFEQYNDTNLDEFTEEEIKRIQDNNRLDINLYHYAQELFYNRYSKLRSLDDHFDDHFNNMGHVSSSVETNEDY